MTVFGWLAYTAAYVVVGNVVALAWFAATSRVVEIPSESGAPIVFALVVVTWPAWLLVALWVLVTRRGARRSDRQTGA